MDQHKVSFFKDKVKQVGDFDLPSGYSYQIFAMLDLVGDIIVIHEWDYGDIDWWELNGSPIWKGNERENDNDNE